MSDIDFLDAGPERPPWLRRLPTVHGAPRRVWVVGLLLVALLGGLGWWADTRLRDRTERQLAGCAQGLQDSWGQASSRLTSMYTYIRAAFVSAPAEVRGGLLTILSEAAQAQVPAVRASLQRCVEVSVWPTHRGLAQQKTDCVARARSFVTYLDGVVADGSAAFESNGDAPSC